jgi:UPF0755 protein
MRSGWGIAVLTAWVFLWSGGLLALRLAQYVHSPTPETPARVEVRPGASVSAIARSLEEAGLGDWERGTQWGMRLWGNPRRYKAGTYVFAPPSSLAKIFSDLQTGRVETVAVTLPEGATVRQMADAFAEAGVVSREAFVTLALDPAAAARWGLPGPTLEGYLFPDTYRFARGLSPETVIDEMVRRFREVAGPLEAEASARKLSLRDWVTLASIVEKETGNASERPLVAAVFLNRLARGMRLESDPTVIYGVEGFDGNLRRADLIQDTPYNTYVRFGLPRGPIANPGRESLQAILRPADVPYLYFVSRNDGTHVFSVTYEEHRRHVDRYQRGGTP